MVSYDVAVVGGGPAGCAAAIVLARAGCRVLVLERSTYGEARIGETFVPEIRVLLERLGVWDRFLSEGHRRSPGMLAAWGRPDPHANDFIVNPYGPGWTVDRARFDAMLAGAAERAGAVVHRGVQVDRCDRGPGGGWLLSTRDAPPQVWSAPLVVDAAGRASPLRRPLGGRVVVHDRLVALTTTVEPTPGHDTGDRRGLVEATEHGWWYSARLPDGHRALSFHTDAAADLRARWAQCLAAAPHTASRAGPAGAAATVRHVAANTQRREPVGDGTWVAAGDAAASHDPLSGLGVYRALESGIDAAGALVARACGEADAIAAYADEARGRFAQYLVQRAAYYRAETRWPESPFWLRRRGAAVAPP